MKRPGGLLVNLTLLLFLLPRVWDDPTQLPELFVSDVDGLVRSIKPIIGLEVDFLDTKS